MYKNQLFKNFLRALSVFMLLIMLCFTLAACTKEPEAPPDDGGDEQHTHSYEASTLIPATFSYCGTTKYTCSCGDTYEAPTPAGNIALRDYKDEEHNSLYGLTVNTEDVQTGPSAVWTPSAGAFYIDEPAVNDLTGYLELNVWIKNNSSSPINLVFYAFSDFIGTPAADCYYGTFTVESGWYKYSIPISNLVASGSPVGFDKIDYFSIEVLRTKVDPSTTLYIDTLYAATEKSGGYVADKLAPTKNAVVFYEGSDACLFNQMRGKRNFKVVSDSNTTFIPAAILAEHRGATNIVSSANALSFSYNGTEYSYSLGQSFDYTAVENGNNAGKALSSKAISSGDYLMLPMEVCAEIFGYKLFFDRMGLVLFSDNKIAYSLSSDESITVNGGNITSLFTVIEQVAYEHYTGSEIIALMNSKYPDDKHGRLMIDQAKFDELKELLKTDETLKAWVAGIEKGYGKSSSKFSAAPNVYHLSDGYRLLNASRDVMNKVMSWSLLYKLTDDTAYAERVWKELESVCKFTDPVTGAKSWHPEHFLDTAEIMYPFAIAYDWLYYYWTPERREILEDAALELGFGAALGFGGVADWWKDGKNSANAIANGYNGYKYKAPYPYNAVNSDPSIFYTGAPWTNNWNGVCNGGMTALCLAFANVNDEFREYSEYLLSCIFYSVQPGLIEGYAPDGGYPESPGYWAYGTTYLAILFSCLQSACGTDFGFTNSPGFSESFYFVSYLASTNNNGSWNYHDSGTGVDTTIYLWFAGSSGDKNLATMRKQYLDKGTTPTIWDVIFYDPNGFNESTVTLNLDAYYYGIDTVTFRSSWDENALFCGLHGGANGAPHGNLDIGNFIIELDGVRFIRDLGSDNYNLQGFGSSSVKYFTNPYRYWFYRERAEGQNTLVINPSLVDTSKTGSGDSAQGKNFDQLLSANAQILEFESGTTGAYAVVDMECAYIEAKAGSIRGMLVTNNRSAVVVQDEIKLSGSTNTIYSFLHVRSSATVKISEDGRSATVKYSGKTMLISLVVDDETNGTLTFGLMNAEYLPETKREPIEGEDAGKNHKKLYILAENCTDYRVAMVFQILDDDLYEYTWTDIENWKAE